jgi:NTE family protein
MGAYVGALLASGLKYADLHRLAAEIQDRHTLLKLLDPIVPPSQGLIRGIKMRQHLERTLGSVTFAELPLPLMVVATDLDALAPHVFQRGSVAEAVHASASIPGVFAPAELQGRRFIDGGASTPLPVTLMRERMGVDRVLAVSVLLDHVETSRHKRTSLLGRWLGWLNLMREGNVLDTFRRALITAQRQLVAREEAAADIVIRPQLPGSHWYDYENYEAYIQAGRIAAQAALPQILRLYQNPPNHESTTHETRLGCLTA